MANELKWTVYVGISSFILFPRFLQFGNTQDLSFTQFLFLRGFFPLFLMSLILMHRALTQRSWSAASSFLSKFSSLEILTLFQYHCCGLTSSYRIPPKVPARHTQHGWPMLSPHFIPARPPTPTRLIDGNRSHLLSYFGSNSYSHWCPWISPPPVVPMPFPPGSTTIKSSFQGSCHWLPNCPKWQFSTSNLWALIQPQAITIRLIFIRHLWPRQKGEHGKINYHWHYTSPIPRNVNGPSPQSACTDISLILKRASLSPHSL